MSKEWSLDSYYVDFMPLATSRMEKGESHSVYSIPLQMEITADPENLNIIILKFRYLNQSEDMETIAVGDNKLQIGKSTKRLFNIFYPIDRANAAELSADEEDIAKLLRVIRQVLETLIKQKDLIAYTRSGNKSGEAPSIFEYVIRQYVNELPASA